jgi:outer membrane receptor protein involved in Fe transport
VRRPSKSRTDIDYSGYVNRFALYTALNNGTWNPVGGNDPSLVAQISPRFSNSLTSKLNYFDLVGSRELMQLGAGPLALAAGVHWHKREQDAPPAALTANGTVASTTAFVIGKETNTAAFGELQATPIKSLELHVSGRYDHYDTYGNSFTPAASFKWAPVSAFGVRGTFARGFRAPNPAFSYISEVAGASFQLAGTQGPSVVSGATGSPKDRAQFTLGYARGPLDITATMNYTSDFSTKDPSIPANDCASTAADVGGRLYFDGLTQPDYYCHVASFTTTNLNVQYKLSQNLTLKGSILNLFDRQPPIDVATYGNSGTQTAYNASLHQAGAVGRFYSLGLAYTFQATSDPAGFAAGGGRR